MFSFGAAEVLAEFARADAVLNGDTAVVDKGGEGLLPVLIEVIKPSARARGFQAIEWSVYARNCAQPNPKLSRVLEKLNFEPDNGGGYYHRRVSTNASLLKRHS